MKAQSREDAKSQRRFKAGLVHQAARELGFDPAFGFVIGDQASDVQLGKELGAVTILATTGYGSQVREDPDVQPDYVVASLAEAAQVIRRLLSHG